MKDGKINWEEMDEEPSREFEEQKRELGKQAEEAGVPHFPDDDDS